MRIIVMSDTHIERVTDKLQAICTQYCSDADLVIHLGDWTGDRVLDFMEQYPLEAVSGNTDNHRLRDRLPTKKVIHVKDHRIGIIHGWGSAHDLRTRLRREFTNVDAILFGHTHQAFLLQENGILWFNPGSVFHGRHGAPASLGILHVQDRLRGEIVEL
ncbi:MAG: YfcE family phosphodiesterase [Syntrophobacteraceae bacterium]|nr:YfcE family phosphodiesterase [Syntrophobacteraceae bacterium]